MSKVAYNIAVKVHTDQTFQAAQACVLCVQYMVVYQCIVAAASNTAFFVDGSSFSVVQVIHFVLI